MAISALPSTTQRQQRFKFCLGRFWNLSVHNSTVIAYNNNSSSFSKMIMVAYEYTCAEARTRKTTTQSTNKYINTLVSRLHAYVSSTFSKRQTRQALHIICGGGGEPPPKKRKTYRHLRSRAGRELVDGLEAEQVPKESAVVLGARHEKACVCASVASTSHRPGFIHCVLGEYGSRRVNYRVCEGNRHKQAVKC